MNKLTNKLSKLEISHDENDLYDKTSYLKTKINKDDHKCSNKKECNTCWWS
jgi:hypothetical protein